MPFDYTTTALIAQIKRRGSIPTNQALFENPDFLSFADEEMQTVIAPMIMSMKGSYFLANNDTVMTSAVNYEIPGDAIGTKIESCYILDDDGKEYKIPEVTRNDVTAQNASNYLGLGFYIEDNSVILIPNAIVGKTLRMKYYRRASKLVPVEEAAQVVSVSGADITVNAVPSGWALNDLVDIIDENPPFTTLGQQYQITSIASNIIQLTATLSGSVTFATGQWIALDGDTPIPQITPEAHPVLAQAVVVKCLEAMGDPNLVTSQAKFEQIKKNFIDMVQPRADGQSKKIVNRQGPIGWNKWRRYEGSGTY